MDEGLGVQQLEEKLLVQKIERGIVIDHIAPCKGFLIYNIFNPDPDSTAVVAKNVPSKKYGRKDLVKIEGEYITSSLVNIIGLISPTATINIIAESKVKSKQRVKPPEEVVGVIDCRNPSCMSKGPGSRFSVQLDQKLELSSLRCTQCGYTFYYEDAVKEITHKASSGILVSRSRVQRELLTLLINKGGLRYHQEFKLKSGRVSPYFINVGALNDGESLAKLRWVFASYAAMLLKDGFIEDFEYVFGPAYKGINIASLTCEGLREYYGMNKRFMYDRKEAKTYGDLSMDSSIVGSEYFVEGGRILIVDDTITTGKTKISSIERLESLGKHKVVAVIVAVDRQEMSDEEGLSAVEFLERKLGVKVFSILPASTIYDMIKKELSGEEKDMWVRYYDRYGVVKLSK
ncbi:MAG: orotate phosphoribosyltransferase [Candidatus Caldarchaeum sp.]|nr:orotate phosphoribosyltransferase [Candidatus Caldarchaeum sp.]MDW7977673.1 orotate phosphoribosyltransferase [Candidatus Caldarchaeum sp.]